MQTNLKLQSGGSECIIQQKLKFQKNYFHRHIQYIENPQYSHLMDIVWKTFKPPLISLLVNLHAF